jgi:uncharacterized protein
MTRSAFTASRVLARLAQLLLVLLLWVPGTAFALDVPPLRAHVNDNADMLSPSAEAALEQKLTAYEQRSQQQFALLTIDTLDGDALEDFSIRVVEAWKLGRKGKDDGLLLLVVKNDRKLRFEVGYGLEGDITDAFTARVTRNVLTPALRAGKAEQGIDQAFDVLMKKASGEAVPDVAVAPPKRPRREGPSPFGLVVLALFLLPFLLPLIFSRGRGRRGGFMIGGLGGFGGYGGGWGGSGGGSWGGGGGGWGGGGGGGGGGGWSGGGGGFGGGGSSGSW